MAKVGDKVVFKDSRRKPDSCPAEIVALHGGKGEENTVKLKVFPEGAEPYLLAGVLHISDPRVKGKGVPRCWAPAPVAKPAKPVTSKAE